LIAVLVVLVVVGIGAYFLFRGDSSSAGDGTLGEPDDPSVPEFNFTVTEARAVPTSQTPEKKLGDAAESASRDATATMDEIYTEAFLDPGSWEGGDYEAVWELFEGPARSAAQDEVDALTAGSGAGESFETILPAKGKADVSVLMNDKDDPEALEVSVSFSAEATAGDGTVTRLVSTGDYFLQRFGNLWKVTSFEVRRSDKAAGGGGESATPTESSP
jgi:hypothetical protein